MPGFMTLKEYIEQTSKVIGYLGKTWVFKNQDLFNKCVSSMINADKTFDPSKGSRGTWRLYYIRGTIHNHSKRKTVPEGKPLVKEKMSADFTPEFDATLRSVLTQDEYELIRERFVEDKTYRELAKQDKVSHQWKHEKTNKILKKLRDKSNLLVG